MIRNRAAAKAAAAWWLDLQPRPPERAGDRAALARLRRCASVAEAMQEPATIHLFRCLQADSATDLPDVALAAAVLAHVREDVADPPAVARAIGPEQPEKPETALLKPLRFRRLMETRAHDERLAAFRRLAALSGGRLNVTDLASALLRWDDSCRQRWTFQYWNAGPAPAAAGQTAKEATP